MQMEMKLPHTVRIHFDFLSLSPSVCIHLKESQLYSHNRNTLSLLLLWSFALNLKAWNAWDSCSDGRQTDRWVERLRWKLSCQLSLTPCSHVREHTARYEVRIYGKLMWTGENLSGDELSKLILNSSLSFSLTLSTQLSFSCLFSIFVCFTCFVFSLISPLMLLLILSTSPPNTVSPFWTTWSVIIWCTEEDVSLLGNGHTNRKKQQIWCWKRGWCITDAKHHHWAVISILSDGANETMFKA